LQFGKKTPFMIQAFHRDLTGTELSISQSVHWTSQFWSKVLDYWSVSMIWSIVNKELGSNP